MVLARDVMVRDVLTAPRDRPVLETVAQMAERGVGAVVVCDGPRPVGIFSERDLLTRVVLRRLDAAQVRAGEVMTEPIHVAHPDDTAESLFQKMRALSIRHVPIVEGGEVVGIVSARDLLDARARPLRTELREWMEEALAVAPEQTLSSVVNAMNAARTDAAVVVDEGRRVLGIFTDRDLLRRVAARNVDIRATSVRDVMTADPETCDVSDDFETVYARAAQMDVHHVPILSGGALAGIVSLRDVLRVRERVLDWMLHDTRDRLSRYHEVLERSPDARVEHLMVEVERLRDEAITDELTGLYNYRYFQLRFAEEIDRARRFEQPLTLCIVDIDNFKRVNDGRGHRAGDEVLREVARIMSSSLREYSVKASFRRTDLVARYGGEEFVIILPHTEAPGAVRACERVREAIARHPFLAAPGQEPLRVTASFGVAHFPEHGDEREPLLQAADEALYRAKRAGKNRVVVAGG